MSAKIPTRYFPDMRSKIPRWQDPDFPDGVIAVSQTLHRAICTEAQLNLFPDSDFQLSQTAQNAPVRSLRVS